MKISNIVLNGAGPGESVGLALTLNPCLDAYYTFYSSLQLSRLSWLWMVLRFCELRMKFMYTLFKCMGAIGVGVGSRRLVSTQDYVLCLVKRGSDFFLWKSLNF